MYHEESDGSDQEETVSVMADTVVSDDGIVRSVCVRRDVSSPSLSPSRHASTSVLQQCVSVTRHTTSPASVDASEPSDILQLLQYKRAFVQLVQEQMQRFGQSWEQWREEMEALAEIEALAATQQSGYFLPYLETTNAISLGNQQPSNSQDYEHYINTNYQEPYHPSLSTYNDLTEFQNGSWEVSEWYPCTFERKHLNNNYQVQEQYRSLSHNVSKDTVKNRVAYPYVYENPYICEVNINEANKHTSGLHYAVNGRESLIPDQGLATSNCEEQTYSLNMTEDKQELDRWNDVAAVGTAHGLKEGQLNPHTYKQKENIENDQRNTIINECGINVQSQIENYLEWRNNTVPKTGYPVENKCKRILKSQQDENNRALSNKHITGTAIPKLQDDNIFNSSSLQDTTHYETANIRENFENSYHSINNSTSVQLAAHSNAYLQSWKTQSNENDVLNKEGKFNLKLDEDVIWEKESHDKMYYLPSKEQVVSERRKEKSDFGKKDETYQEDINDKIRTLKDQLSDISNLTDDLSTLCGIENIHERQNITLAQRDKYEGAQRKHVVPYSPQHKHSSVFSTKNLPHSKNTDNNYHNDTYKIQNKEEIGHHDDQSTQDTEEKQHSVSSIHEVKKENQEDLNALHNQLETPQIQMRAKETHFKATGGSYTPQNHYDKTRDEKHSKHIEHESKSNLSRQSSYRIVQDTQHFPEKQKELFANVSKTSQYLLQFSPHSELNNRNETEKCKSSWYKKLPDWEDRSTSPDDTLEPSSILTSLEQDYSSSSTDEYSTQQCLHVKNKSMSTKPCLPKKLRRKWSKDENQSPSEYKYLFSGKTENLEIYHLIPSCEHDANQQKNYNEKQFPQKFPGPPQDELQWTDCEKEDNEEIESTQSIKYNDLSNSKILSTKFRYSTSDSTQMLESYKAVGMRQKSCNSKYSAILDHPKEECHGLSEVKNEGEDLSIIWRHKVEDGESCSNNKKLLTKSENNQTDNEYNSPSSESNNLDDKGIFPTNNEEKISAWENIANTQQKEVCNEIHTNKMQGESRIVGNTGKSVIIIALTNQTKHKETILKKIATEFEESDIEKENIETQTNESTLQDNDSAQNKNQITLSKNNSLDSINEILFQDLSETHEQHLSMESKSKLINTLSTQKFRAALEETLPQDKVKLKLEFSHSPDKLLPCRKGSLYSMLSRVPQVPLQRENPTEHEFPLTEKAKLEIPLTTHIPKKENDSNTDFSLTEIITNTLINNGNTEKLNVRHESKTKDSISETPLHISYANKERSNIFSHAPISHSTNKIQRFPLESNTAVRHMQSNNQTLSLQENKQNIKPMNNITHRLLPVTEHHLQSLKHRNITAKYPAVLREQHTSNATERTLSLINVPIEREHYVKYEIAMEPTQALLESKETKLTLKKMPSKDICSCKAEHITHLPSVTQEEREFDSVGNFNSAHIPEPNTFCSQIAMKMDSPRSKTIQSETEIFLLPENEELTSISGQENMTVSSKKAEQETTNIKLSHEKGNDDSKKLQVNEDKNILHLSETHICHENRKSYFLTKEESFAKEILGNESGGSVFHTPRHEIYAAQQKANTANTFHSNSKRDKSISLAENNPSPICRDENELTHLQLLGKEANTSTEVCEEKIMMNKLGKVISKGEEAKNSNIEAECNKKLERTMNKSTLFTEMHDITLKHLLVEKSSNDTQMVEDINPTLHMHIHEIKQETEIHEKDLERNKTFTVNAQTISEAPSEDKDHQSFPPSVTTKNFIETHIHKSSQENDQKKILQDVSLEEREQGSNNESKKEYSFTHLQSREMNIQKAMYHKELQTIYSHTTTEHTAQNELYTENADRFSPMSKKRFSPDKQTVDFKQIKQTSSKQLQENIHNFSEISKFTLPSNQEQSQKDRNTTEKQKMTQRTSLLIANHSNEEGRSDASSDASTSKISMQPSQKHYQEEASTNTVNHKYSTVNITQFKEALKAQETPRKPYKVSHALVKKFLSLLQDSQQALCSTNTTSKETLNTQSSFTEQKQCSNMKQSKKDKNYVYEMSKNKTISTQTFSQEAEVCPKDRNYKSSLSKDVLLIKDKKPDGSEEICPKIMQPTKKDISDIISREKITPEDKMCHIRTLNKPKTRELSIKCKETLNPNTPKEFSFSHTNSIKQKLQSAIPKEKEKYISPKDSEQGEQSISKILLKEDMIGVGLSTTGESLSTNENSTKYTIKRVPVSDKNVEFSALINQELNRNKYILKKSIPPPAQENEVEQFQKVQENGLQHRKSQKLCMNLKDFPGKVEETQTINVTTFHNVAQLQTGGKTQLQEHLEQIDVWETLPLSQLSLPQSPFPQTLSMASFPSPPLPLHLAPPVLLSVSSTPVSSSSCPLDNMLKTIAAHQYKKTLFLIESDSEIEESLADDSQESTHTIDEDSTVHENHSQDMHVAEETKTSVLDSQMSQQVKKTETLHKEIESAPSLSTQHKFKKAKYIMHKCTNELLTLRQAVLHFARAIFNEDKEKLPDNSRTEQREYKYRRFEDIPAMKIEALKQITRQLFKGELRPEEVLLHNEHTILNDSKIHQGRKNLHNVENIIPDRVSAKLIKGGRRKMPPKPYGSFYGSQGKSQATIETLKRTTNILLTSELKPEHMQKWNGDHQSNVSPVPRTRLALQYVAKIILYDDTQHSTTLCKTQQKSHKKYFTLEDVPIAKIEALKQIAKELVRRELNMNQMQPVNTSHSKSNKEVEPLEQQRQSTNEIALQGNERVNPVESVIFNANLIPSKSTAWSEKITGNHKKPEANDGKIQPQVPLFLYKSFCPLTRNGDDSDTKYYSTNRKYVVSHMLSVPFRYSSNQKTPFKQPTTQSQFLPQNEQSASTSTASPSITSHQDKNMNGNTLDKIPSPSSTNKVINVHANGQNSANKPLINSEPVVGHVTNVDTREISICTCGQRQQEQQQQNGAKWCAYTDETQNNHKERDGNIEAAWALVSLPTDESIKIPTTYATTAKNDEFTDSSEKTSTKVSMRIRAQILNDTASHRQQHYHAHSGDSNGLYKNTHHTSIMSQPSSSQRNEQGNQIINNDSQIITKTRISCRIRDITLQDTNNSSPPLSYAQTTDNEKLKLKPNTVCTTKPLIAEETGTQNTSKYTCLSKDSTGKFNIGMRHFNLLESTSQPLEVNKPCKLREPCPLQSFNPNLPTSELCEESTPCPKQYFSPNQSTSESSEVCTPCLIQYSNICQSPRQSRTVSPTQSSTSQPCELCPKQNSSIESCEPCTPCPIEYSSIESCEPYTQCLTQYPRQPCVSYAQCPTQYPRQHCAPHTPCPTQYPRQHCGPHTPCPTQYPRQHCAPHTPCPTQYSRQHCEPCTPCPTQYSRQPCEPHAPWATQYLRRPCEPRTCPTQYPRQPCERHAPCPTQYRRQPCEPCTSSRTQYRRQPCEPCEPSMPCPIQYSSQHGHTSYLETRERETRIQYRPPTSRSLPPSPVDRKIKLQMKKTDERKIHEKAKETERKGGQKYKEVLQQEEGHWPEKKGQKERRQKKSYVVGERKKERNEKGNVKDESKGHEEEERKKDKMKREVFKESEKVIRHEKRREERKKSDKEKKSEDDDEQVKKRQEEEEYEKEEFDTRHDEEQKAKHTGTEITESEEEYIIREVEMYEEGKEDDTREKMREEEKENEMMKEHLELPHTETLLISSSSEDIDIYKKSSMSEVEEKDTEQTEQYIREILMEVTKALLLAVKEDEEDDERRLQTDVEESRATEEMEEERHATEEAERHVTEEVEERYVTEEVEAERHSTEVEKDSEREEKYTTEDLHSIKEEEEEKYSTEEIEERHLIEDKFTKKISVLTEHEIDVLIDELLRNVIRGNTHDEDKETIGKEKESVIQDEEYISHHEVYERYSEGEREQSTEQTHTKVTGREEEKDEKLHQEEEDITKEVKLYEKEDTANIELLELGLLICEQLTNKAPEKRSISKDKEEMVRKDMNSKIQVSSLTEDLIREGLIKVNHDIHSSDSVPPEVAKFSKTLEKLSAILQTMEKRQSLISEEDEEEEEEKKEVLKEREEERKFLEDRIPLETETLSTTLDSQVPTYPLSLILESQEPTKMSVSNEEDRHSKDSKEQSVKDTSNYLQMSELIDEFIREGLDKITKDEQFSDQLVPLQIEELSIVLESQDSRKVSDSEDDREEETRKYSKVSESPLPIESITTSLDTNKKEAEVSHYTPPSEIEKTSSIIKSQKSKGSLGSEEMDRDQTTKKTYRKEEISPRTRGFSTENFEERMEEKRESKSQTVPKETKSISKSESEGEDTEDSRTHMYKKGETMEIVRKKHEIRKKVMKLSEGESEPSGTKELTVTFESRASQELEDENKDIKLAKKKHISPGTVEKVDEGTHSDDDTVFPERGSMLYDFRRSRRSSEFGEQGERMGARRSSFTRSLISPEIEEAIKKSIEKVRRETKISERQSLPVEIDTMSLVLERLTKILESGESSQKQTEDLETLAKEENKKRQEENTVHDSISRQLSSIGISEDFLIPHFEEESTEEYMHKLVETIVSHVLQDLQEHLPEKPNEEDERQVQHEIKHDVVSQQSDEQSPPQKSASKVMKYSRCWCKIMFLITTMFLPLMVLLGAVLGIALCRPRACLDDWPPFVRKFLRRSLFLPQSQESAMNLHGIY